MFESALSEAKDLFGCAAEEVRLHFGTGANACQMYLLEFSISQLKNKFAVLSVV